MKRSEKKRILHLASFNGNVGDILNHQGFYKGIKELTGSTPVIKKLEIREFYRGNKKFDQNFTNFVNKFDTLIVGGGNYFELWVDHSPTGTSIMIEPEDFSRIKIPVLFNALGVDLGQGGSKKNIKKFKLFLDEIFSDPNHAISLRNDGALKNIKSLFGENFSKKFIHTPDAGFFVDFSYKQSKENYCLINLPGDMEEIRYPGGKMHSSESFIDEFALLLTKLVEQESFDKFILIPHIYKDLESVFNLLKKLPDKIAREKFKVAELNLGEDISRFKEYYENSSMVFASRFHSNISGLKTNKQIVALENYVQITNLYDELNMKEKLLDVRKKGFSDKFFDNLHNDNYTNNPKDFNKNIEKDYKKYLQLISRFLS